MMYIQHRNIKVYLEDEENTLGADYENVWVDGIKKILAVVHKGVVEWANLPR